MKLQRKDDEKAKLGKKKKQNGGREDVQRGKNRAPLTAEEQTYSRPYPLSLLPHFGHLFHLGHAENRRELTGRFTNVISNYNL